MPEKKDILTAIENLGVFLKVDALKRAVARVKPNGSLFFYSGGFNLVFQLSVGLKKWAFRVCHVPMGENKKRFQLIADHLNKVKLPYFADFVYDEGGLLVNGQLVDTIRMEWLEESRLKDYIEKNLSDKPALVAVAGDFLKMYDDLRANYVSHGDLQDGNILISDSGVLKLVDYDSVCVPEIEGQPEFVTGLKGFQHPSRFNKNKASLSADHFSALIIYLSILAIAEKPGLWEEYQVKDTAVLLFADEDFSDLKNSNIYRSLQGISNEINQLLAVLVIYLKANSYLDLAPFNSYLEAPEVLFFRSDKLVGLKGQGIELTWQVVNAQRIDVGNHVKNASATGKVVVYPDKDAKYILAASNNFGSTTKELNIHVFPAPVLEFIKVPSFELNSTVRIDSSNIGSPKFDLSFFSKPFTYERPVFSGRSTKLKTLRPEFKAFRPLLISAIYERIRNRLKLSK